MGTAFRFAGAWLASLLLAFVAGQLIAVQFRLSEAVKARCDSVLSTESAFGEWTE